MFIRIKKRKIQSSDPRQHDYSIRFMVVESYRKKGKPRQRVVKYLGSVRRSVLRSPTRKMQVVERFKKLLDRGPFDQRQTTSLKLSLIRVIYHHHFDLSF